MSDLREVTDDLLTDRPSIEDDLRAILDVDNGAESWTFDDVPVDSGTFGELVSRGIVEAVGNEYRLANPDAVKAACENEPRNSDHTDTNRRLSSIPQLQRIDPVLIGALAGVLVLVVVMRTAFFWPSVFRGTDTVLLGNDPYFYRYWLEELFRTGTSVTSPPPALQDHDIAMIAVMYGAASLLGSSQEAVSVVLAWYPVMFAVLTALLVYLIAIVAFADHRVALASVAIYAVTPIVSYRSALGFGDHHAFDYLLVALAVAGLLVLVNERADWRAITGPRIVGFILFSLAIATQVHAWRAGPLLILPVAAYIVFRVASDVRARDSPLWANAWVLGALVMAAILAAIPHVVFNWSSMYRAAAPTLLLAGCLVVVGIGELAARREIAAQTVLGLEVIGGVLVGALSWIAIPDVRSASQQGLAYFVRTGQTNITETSSLLNPEFGVIIAPIFYLGLTFVFAIAALAWAAWSAKNEHRPTRLALTVYTSSFLLFALVQLRFAGQFGILAAVFGGLGFTFLLSAVDVAKRPHPFTNTESETTLARTGEGLPESTALSLPDRQSAFIVAVLFLLVSSLGIAQTAGGGGLLIEDSTYDTAMAINDHATLTEQTWPDNYVFSDWSRNRVYNYYVNNRSRSYRYAQQHYVEFLSSNNASAWYNQLSARPTGYVVVKNVDSEFARTSMQSRLWQNWGSHSNGVAGVGHYRAVYATDERKVFELVPGATLITATSPNSTTIVETEVSVSETAFTYEREVDSSAGGAASVTVPYSGVYEVDDRTVTVDTNSIRAGGYVIDKRLRRPGSPDEIARWTFDEQLEGEVIDRVGDSHGQIRGNPRYRSGVSGAAVAFDGEDDELEITDERAPEIGNNSFTLSFWIRGDLDEASAQYPAVIFNRNNSGYGIWARNNVDDFGVRIGDTDGNSVPNFGIKTTQFSSWTQIVVVLDRTDDELRLYRNSTLVQTSSTESLGTVASNASLFVGSRGGADYAPVEVDSIRMYNDALNGTDINRLNRS